ncbi:MAG: hypothetical protein WCG75_05615 [Armatimonadota bacterium]
MQGISSQVTSVANAISTDPAANAQTRVQGMLLKKALESQKSETAQLLSMLEGKGRIVDIRA